MSAPWQDESIPHMEVAILGAMLLDVVACDDATSTLKAGDFQLDSHRKIYRAILAVMQDGDPVQYLTVQDELERRKQFKDIGGPAYLAFLTEGIPRNLAIETYVRKVKTKALARDARGIFQTGIDRISDGSEDPGLIISESTAALQDAVAQVHEEKTLAMQVTNMLEGLMRRHSGEQKTFVTCGLEEIDHTHGGFAIGELTVIGAYPGQGKSSWLRQAIRDNCKLGNFCHLHTPEMMEDQVLQIFASQEAKVPFRRIRHADRLSDANIEEIQAAARDIMQWPLKIDGTSPVMPAEVIAKTRSVKRKENTKLMGLDYFQKLKYPGKPEHRHIYMNDALVALTELAKNEQVAVVAISSLTEPGGKEAGRPPTMRDFRGSGDIKYEANTAILIHRETDDKTRKLVLETSFIYGKARSDQSGNITQYFNEDYICFEGKQKYLDGLRV